MQPLRLIQMMILILSLLKAMGLLAGVETHDTRAPYYADVSFTRAVSTNVLSTNQLFTNVKHGLARPFTALPPAKSKLPAVIRQTDSEAETIQRMNLDEPSVGSWRFELVR